MEEILHQLMLVFYPVIYFLPSIVVLVHLHYSWGLEPLFAAPPTHLSPDSSNQKTYLPKKELNKIKTPEKYPDEPDDHPKALKPSHRFFSRSSLAMVWVTVGSTPLRRRIGGGWPLTPPPKTWAFDRDPYPYHVWQYGIFTYMKTIENP